MPISSLRRQAVLATAAAFAVLSCGPAHAFAPPHVPQTPSLDTTTSLPMFGGLKGAFANDDSLGKAKDAGLSGGPKYNDQVSVNGKSVPNVVANQKISQVCAAARVKVPYNCQNGECGTCTVMMNGRKVKACVSKVPAGKCNIQTL